MPSSQSSELTPALWKLIVVCSVASFCALLPANAVPQMAHYFAQTVESSERIISWFLLGYGTGPLIYAPVANRYGRKKALFFGFGLALFALILSLYSIYSHMFMTLLVSRFIAGLGTSAGIVIGMVMIKETTTSSEARRLFSLIVLFFAVAPSIAMAGGGALTEFVGFKSIFLLMLMIILLLFMVVMTLKETYLGPLIPLNFKKIVISYCGAVKERPFIYLVMLVTVATAITYVFNGLGPLIAEKSLHVSAALYGELAVIPSLGLFLGASLSTRWSQTKSARNIIHIGLWLMTISSLSMLVLFFLGYLSLVSLITPSLILFLGSAIVVPNAAMTAVGSAKDPAIASSVMNATALFLSGEAVTWSSHFIGLSTLVLPGTLILLLMIGFAFFKIWPLTSQSSN